MLIFVTRKAHSVEVAEKLKARDLKVLLIHGDMHQSERNSVIHKFKHQEAPILVATDVACKFNAFTNSRNATLVRLQNPNLCPHQNIYRSLLVSLSSSAPLS